MNVFENKVAVVTGGAQGIGEAIARGFFSRGAQVAILDINKNLTSKMVEQLMQETPSAGKRVLGLKCNVTDSEDVHQAFNKIVSEFGTVDILVNNAGITRDAIFHKMTPQQWDDVIAVNGRGLFNCTHEAYLIMKAKKYGKIVNLSSTNASGGGGQTNYSFTKAGIIGFTKSLAMEAGRNNINVNCVRPGVIDTPMQRSMPEDLFDLEIEKTTFKRLGQPKEVADLVCYLCSEEASWITGEEILVCGGRNYR